MLKSVSEVVDAFGGVPAMASFIGVTKEAVHNAVRRGSIPQGWRVRIMLEAPRRQLEIEPSLLGIPTNEANGSEAA